MFTLAITFQKSKKDEQIKGELESETAQMEEEDQSTPEKMVDLVQVDPLEIELGYSLIPLVDKAAGGDLLERIKRTRRSLAMELGLIVPQVRITDNLELEPDEYALKLNGDVVGSSRIQVSKLMALNTGETTVELDGEPTTEPAFGIPAYWIDDEQKEAAERSGYKLFDGPTIVATHLIETIRNYAGDLMGRKEVKSLLDSVQKRNSVVVEEITKLDVKIGTVQKVLQDLLAEGISIRNIDTILENVCDYYVPGGSISQLVEFVRTGLKRQISEKLADPGKNIHALVFSPELERELSNLSGGVDGDYSLSLNPDAGQRLINAVQQKVNSANEAGYRELLVTDPILRPALKRLLGRSIPNLSVISYNEVADGYKLDVVDTV